MHASFPVGGNARLSILSEVGWPAIPSAAGQSLLALQFQFARSQWWPTARLVDAKFAQLRQLLLHAVTQVPYYLEHPGRAGITSLRGVTPETFRRWPLLHRREARSKAHQLIARTVPDGHGTTTWTSTSGSTGEPLKIAHSTAALAYHAACSLRSIDWYGLDTGARLATIRPGSMPGGEFPDWGEPANLAYRTGPAARLRLTSDIDEQLDWLCRFDPEYLLSLGNNLLSLAEASERTGRRPRNLRAILSYADRPPPPLRAIALSTWRAAVFDTYSTAEFGPVALQCPAGEGLHVQSESLLVEILRDDGSACEPDETGRVVITDLHNFVMPLIRYWVGDYATAGGKCDCGRGLPLIRAIEGRASNMAIDPTGRRFWPLLSPRIWLDSPVLQRQLVQTAPSTIEIRYIAEHALEAPAQRALSEALSRSLGYPYEFRFVKVDRIDRPDGGKFEEFITRMDV